MLEILAPAGDMECAKVAIDNGANAVYLGYSAYSARQNAENFTLENLREIITHAHVCNAKVYVAMNTLVKDGETEDFLRTLLRVWSVGADAIILQDLLLGKAVKSKYPEIVLHLSTQAGVCDENGARFAKECGFSRVILARETPLDEIKKIATVMETEVFVQGALCTCFSGQCYFSSFAGGNSGNRGRCKQPCRKRYIYDRNGNTEKTYALSLSDLCVGEEVEKYIRAGVVSFKIEGRMRRKEYVASAVRYYRGVLDCEKDLDKRLSDLKRTYNRGNYTKGLAFGQDKRLLSTAVQGHIGEKVGVVKVVSGNYFVESAFIPRDGDAFKILREGKEVGGALFSKTERRGFVIRSNAKLRAGDSVFITTDTEVNTRVLQSKRFADIDVYVTIAENEHAVVEANGIRVLSAERLQSARSQALTAENLAECFSKTDGLPIHARVHANMQGCVFMTKSALNALRRDFYSALIASLETPDRKTLEYSDFETFIPKGTNAKSAVIAERFDNVETDIAIYKSKDFSLPPPTDFLQGAFEKYIYYPAFVTERDLRQIEEWIRLGIDGIYAENYGGLYFAKKHGLKVFAGTGLNTANALALQSLLSYPFVAYYALSKELTETEQRALSGDRAFALTAGDVKIMDLCYCPFGKSCKTCDQKDLYKLTDENNRIFPVRRYKSADGSCRFEVYNCARLACEIPQTSGRLFDYSIDGKNKETKYTSGHARRGVL